MPLSLQCRHMHCLRIVKSHITLFLFFFFFLRSWMICNKTCCNFDTSLDSEQIFAEKNRKINQMSHSSFILRQKTSTVLDLTCVKRYFQVTAATLVFIKFTCMQYGLTLQENMCFFFLFSLKSRNQRWTKPIIRIINSICVNKFLSIPIPSSSTIKLLHKRWFWLIYTMSNSSLVPFF